ncbi:hypothetical protein GCM10010151_16010 [Actinoallomurus spadix]|uniref:Uncharacterized protein n=1 Tax=Actinoallomurus spadix TaxID=79912 RepID=A0ABN0W6M4_9ACTN
MRHARPEHGPGREPVALDEGDPFEMGGQDAGREQAGHAPTDDDGVFAFHSGLRGGGVSYGSYENADIDPM